MSEAIDDLVLEHLQALRADIAAVRETQGEHGHRLNRIETAIASLRRDQADDAENAALQSPRIDRLGERLDRIERRLELTDDSAAHGRQARRQDMVEPPDRY